MPATPLSRVATNPSARQAVPAATVPRHAGAVAKTCDARGMAEIHRMFKAGFGEGRTLIEGVAEGDIVHAEVVADHLAMLSTGLHAHHEGEDTMLWDPLEQRAPSVRRARRAHEGAARPSCSCTSPRSTRCCRRGVRAAGQRMPRASCPRSTGSITRSPRTFPTRRAIIVPVMETVITQKEVDALSDHGRKATPKGRMFLQLGAILAAQPDGGAEWQREHLPPPVRLLWRWVGRPKYEANRAELVGDRRS